MHEIWIYANVIFFSLTLSYRLYRRLRKRIWFMIIWLLKISFIWCSHTKSEARWILHLQSVLKVNYAQTYFLKLCGLLSTIWEDKFVLTILRCAHYYFTTNDSSVLFVALAISWWSSEKNVRHWCNYLGNIYICSRIGLEHTMMFVVPLLERIKRERLRSSFLFFASASFPAFRVCSVG